jgi:DNA (cytosine-5)-methyltransferase 1
MGDGMKVGELFAGIGGIGLGLEATGGFEVVWQVEKDDYATKVLEKNWPAVRRWDDVKTFPPETGDWDVDLITAGFPCQDISVAGKGEGLDGKKSGLFYEVIRIAGIIKPRWLLLENVSALLIRGIGEVLGEVASISGSDNTPHFKRMEYHCLPAAVFGAPHRRDRFFLLANADSNANPSDQGETEETDCLSEVNWEEGCSGMSGRAGDDTKTLADSNIKGLQGQRRLEETSQICTQEAIRLFSSRVGQSQWGIEPDVDRMVNGVPRRVDRTKCLGNAVVPQVAQFMGEIILQRDQELFRKEE